MNNKKNIIKILTVGFVIGILNSLQINGMVTGGGSLARKYPINAIEKINAIGKINAIQKTPRKLFQPPSSSLNEITPSLEMQTLTNQEKIDAKTPDATFLASKSPEHVSQSNLPYRVDQIDLQEPSSLVKARQSEYPESTDLITPPQNLMQRRLGSAKLAFNPKTSQALSNMAQVPVRAFSSSAKASSKKTINKKATKSSWNLLGSYPLANYFVGNFHGKVVIPQNDKILLHEYYEPIKQINLKDSNNLTYLLPKTIANDPIIDIATTPDGKLATLTKKGHITLTEKPGNAPTYFVDQETTDIFSQIALSPNGKYLVTKNSKGRLNLWDITDPLNRDYKGSVDLPRNLPGSMTIVEDPSFSEDIYFSSDSNHLIAVQTKPDPNNSFKVITLNLQGGALQEENTFTLPIWTTKIAISPDGKYAALALDIWDNPKYPGFFGRAIQIINLKTGKTVASLQDIKNVQAITLDQDGNVVFDQGSTLNFWNWQKPSKKIVQQESSSNLSTIRNITISPDGDTLALLCFTQDPNDRSRFIDHLEIWERKTKGEGAKSTKTKISESPMPIQIQSNVQAEGATIDVNKPESENPVTGESQLSLRQSMKETLERLTPDALKSKMDSWRDYLTKKTS